MALSDLYLEWQKAGMSEMTRHSKVLANFAQASDRLLLALDNADFASSSSAYEKLKRQYLNISKNQSERLEIRRRVAEGLLRVAARESPELFLKHLRRLERLGYSSADIVVWACSVASHLAQNRQIRQRLLAMMRRAERMLKSPRLARPYVAEQEVLLKRIRAAVSPRED